MEILLVSFLYHQRFLWTAFSWNALKLYVCRNKQMPCFLNLRNIIENLHLFFIFFLNVTLSEIPDKLVCNLSCKSKSILISRSVEMLSSA